MSELRKLTVSHSGRQILTVCLFCHKNEVLIVDWNKRCKECREKQKVKDAAEQRRIMLGVGTRDPAAIIDVYENTKKQEVFVDKFGKELDNPGYDLDNDPRGWKHTGNLPPSTEIIK